MENNNWLSIKKQYFIDERWDVLAHGLNEVFMGMDLDIRVNIENTIDDKRGECVLLKFEKEKK